jgi:hypothetical protein
MISRRLRLITRKQIYRRWWPTHEDLDSFLVGCLTCTAFGPVLDFMGELPCRDIKLCTDGYMQALSSCEFKYQSSLIFVNLYRRRKGHFDPQIYRRPCPLPRASKQGRSFQQPAIFKPRSSFSSLSSNQCYNNVITLHLTKPTDKSQDDSRPRRYSPFLRSCRVPPSSDCRFRLRRAGMVSVLILDPGMIVSRNYQKMPCSRPRTLHRTTVVTSILHKLNKKHHPNEGQVN